MRTATYRATGTAPLLVRSGSIVPAALVGARLWAASGPALALVVSAGIVVAARLVTLVPRMTIDDDRLVVRRLFSVDRLEAKRVSLRLVPSRVLHYSTWNLVVDAGDSRRVFPWISWTRHDLAGPWTGPIPPPRALRFVAEVESALRHAADAEASG